MMVTFFSSLLADGPISRDILAMYSSPLQRHAGSRIFHGDRCRHFIAVDAFKRRSKAWRIAFALHRRLQTRTIGSWRQVIREAVCDGSRSSGYSGDDTKFAEYLQISADFGTGLRNTMTTVVDAVNSMPTPPAWTAYAGWMRLRGDQSEFCCWLNLCPSRKRRSSTDRRQTGRPRRPQPGSPEHDSRSPEVFERCPPVFPRCRADS